MALRDLIASPGDVVAKRLAADYRIIDPSAHARIIQEVNAAVTAEREACAKIAEGNVNGDVRTWPHQRGDYDNVSMQARLADAIADAIRARS